MKITTISSSSAGCCYLVESGGEQLLIECGIPLKKIREALKHDLSRVVGCLVSHEHGDHCKALPEIDKMTQITFYGPRSINKEAPIYQGYPQQYYRWQPTPVEITLGAGNAFRLRAIKLTHDVECFGYVVSYCYTDSLLFYASDTGELPYRIKGLTHLMIEANYDMDILLDSEQNDALRSRIADNHLSIDQAIEFALRHKDTLQEVHLLHLSDRHSNEADFLKRAQEALGVPVYVAKK